MKRLLVITLLISFSSIINIVCFFKEIVFITTFLQGKALDIMGIILPINIASICQLHISMNSMEERVNREIFTQSRKDIKITMMILVFGFVLSFFLIFIKSCFIDTNGSIVSQKALVHSINAVHLFVFFSYVYALYELCIDSILTIPALIKKN